MDNQHLITELLDIEALAKVVIERSYKLRKKLETVSTVTSARKGLDEKVIQAESEFLARRFAGKLKKQPHQVKR